MINEDKKIFPGQYMASDKFKKLFHADYVSLECVGDFIHVNISGLNNLSVKIPSSEWGADKE